MMTLQVSGFRVFFSGWKKKRGDLTFLLWREICSMASAATWLLLYYFWNEFIFPIVVPNRPWALLCQWGQPLRLPPALDEPADSAGEQKIATQLCGYYFCSSHWPWSGKSTSSSTYLGPGPSQNEHHIGFRQAGGPYFHTNFYMNREPSPLPKGSCGAPGSCWCIKISSPQWH